MKWFISVVVFSVYNIGFDLIAGRYGKETYIWETAGLVAIMFTFTVSMWFSDNK